MQRWKIAEIKGFSLSKYQIRYFPITKKPYLVVSYSKHKAKNINQIAVNDDLYKEANKRVWT